jgi:putative membrane protein
LASILDTLWSGLPILVVQLAATLGLLAIGIACYMALTPFHERQLVREGNTAAGIVFMGALVALAIPLAATLATSVVTLDILIWGVVAVVVQLLAFLLTAALFRGLRAMIEADNVGAACVLVGIQLAVALINAGAMAG